MLGSKADFFNGNCFFLKRSPSIANRYCSHEVMRGCKDRQNSENDASLRSLSALWPTQSEITLGAEHIAVKACDPLPPP